MRLTRRLAVGGIVGPAAFITAWAVLGRRLPGYSPVHDPVSRLAASGVRTQPAMTAGFLTFAVGVGLYARALKEELPGAGAAAVVTAVATAGVAVFPLDSADGAHGVAAGIAYASLAAMPLLAVRPLSRAGRRGAAWASAVTGGAIAAALTASVALEEGVGLAQRIGLTTGDAWIVATALRMLRTR